VLRKYWCVALAVLALVAFEVNHASAGGGGAKGFHARGGTPRAYGNAYWGLGGFGGYGYGLGYGYGYPGWGYSPFLFGGDPVGVPYFSVFPPVYYGYADNRPVMKSPISSSWVGEGSLQPAPASPVIADPPPQPLRIINPYYVEAKADK
jgi:hypothetical protein